ncbi:MAG: tRNA (adenosine(37)-N6)-dimethylallyltransferase MiaA [endosymbiont of Galathealinum brachiosum]|uniref:tRNA dimethylallyltransferase n=1 Tax=endosymbiont of Galathealinum brachiosum TaxID=2200906 RepID=A0A370DL48_9GAMM|nr:MAG: tRNA (adenosine(37)-N6)-dimethylallyltransferase MiaA [endosymbiont of Galathealinum brachiosum]
MTDLIIQRPTNAPTDSPTVIMIMGPTAAGKTELAIRCAEQFGCELISVDSALVYREMDIGTAKPSAEELARAPHKLIDIIDPSESYSAASFREDALSQIQSTISRGKTPVLVGGTMLYYKTLQEGLSELPAADESIRAQLEEDAKAFGWQVMHDRLKQIDPVSAERIHQNDPQRIQRALEVYEISGRTLTDFWQQQSSQSLPYNLVKIAFFPEDRDLLKQRIAMRFHQMLELGFIDEVKALRQRGDLNLEMPSMRCVGYRQVWEHLDGLMSYDEMTERAIIATRQLAKRQLTWLRKEKNANFYDVNQAIYLKILKKLKNLL